MSTIHMILLIGGLLWAVVSLFSGWIFYMAWQAFLDMRDNFKGLKEDLKELKREQADCQKDLPETYATWESLMGEAGIITEIKKDRNSRWKDQEKLNRRREHEIAQIQTKLKLAGGGDE